MDIAFLALEQTDICWELICAPGLFQWGFVLMDLIIYRAILWLDE